MKNLTEIHPVFDTPEENNRLRELLAIRQEVYVI